MQNTFGNSFKISVYGASHSEEIGVIVEGVPAGISLCEEDLLPEIDRRRSGALGTTPRREADLPILGEGLKGGVTTGEPLRISFKNGNTRSSDYDIYKAMPRPGHVDYVASVRWPELDLRGGGQFSGRLTLPIVAAGVLARKMHPELSYDARIVELGGIPAASAEETALEQNPAWKEAIRRAIEEGDSLGGIVECTVKGLPVGVGEPMFDSVESVIAHAIFSIPGVRGIEFGDGFGAARMKGSEHNDPIGLDGIPLKNGAGGANGGLTSGAPIVFRVAFKPTSSIRKAQHTMNRQTGKMDELVCPGRHDACFVLRTLPVVEAMAAISLANLFLAKEKSL